MNSTFNSCVQQCQCDRNQQHRSDRIELPVFSVLAAWSQAIPLAEAIVHVNHSSMLPPLPLLTYQQSYYAENHDMSGVTSLKGQTTPAQCQPYPLQRQGSFSLAHARTDRLIPSILLLKGGESVLDSEALSSQSCLTLVLSTTPFRKGRRKEGSDDHAYSELFHGPVPENWVRPIRFEILHMAAMQFCSCP